MARCGCASDTCDCVIVAGNYITLYGTGTKSNPYVIEGTEPVIEIEGGGTGAAGRLIGEIITYGGDDLMVPPGWAICRGQPLSRVIYAGLYAIIKDSYGAGDGSTTFNVPDYSGRVGIGQGTGPQGAVGHSSKGGALSFTIGAGNIPQHYHDITHTHPAVNSGTSSIGAPTIGTAGEGNHQHDMTKSKSVGESGGSFRMGLDASGGSGMGGIATSGWHGHALTIPDHQHYIPQAQFVGTTAWGGGVAAPAAISIMQPWLAEQRLIYHGVGV